MLTSLSLKTTVLAIGILTVGTFLAALYPALIISDFKPVIFFQGGSMNVLQGERFRNWLLTFQFLVSTAVMILAFGIYSQISFLKHRDTGIDTSCVVVVKAPAMVDSTWQKIDPVYLASVENFRNEILQYPHIKDMTAISHSPGEEVTWGSNGYRKRGDDRNHYLKVMGIDYQFLEMFRIKLVAGRNFQRENTADKQANILVNEAAVRELGFKSVEAAINQPVDFFYQGKKEPVGTIVGVVANYQQETAHRGISPMFYRLLPKALLSFAIRIDENEKSQSVDNIRSAYSSLFPTFAFSYDFLDDVLIHDLKDDEHFYQTFILFSLASVSLCCFGLFGIASLSITRQLKEVAIRKLLGSTLSQTVMFLLRKFLILAMVSIILATVISYFLLNGWLHGFPNRVDLQVRYFLMPGAMMVILIVIIVGYHSLKAFALNPLKNLRVNN